MTTTMIITILILIVTIVMEYSIVRLHYLCIFHNISQQGLKK